MTNIFELFYSRLEGVKEKMRENGARGGQVHFIVSKFNEAGLLMYLNDCVPGWSHTRAIGSHIAEITPPEIMAEISEAMIKAKNSPREPVTWVQQVTTRKGRAEYYFELMYMVGGFTLVSTVSRL